MWKTIMSEILALRNVYKQFSGFRLEDISFSLQPGYIMGLVGPNRSGKTTTIKLIMNMLKRDAGAITVDGIDTLAGETEVKARIGYVADENIFVEQWWAADVARALSIYYPTFDSQLFQENLQRFELPEDKMINDFSHGMKTRMMLAAVLSRQTRLLLLDELTSGLDPVVRVELLDILQDYIRDDDCSVLFSTHITTDLEKVADFITFLYRGRLVFTQNKDEVLSEYRIVKGGPEDLTGSLRQALIGLRQNAMGFEGLIKVDNGLALPERVVMEAPTLDEIIVFHTLGVKV
jgi:ABC-2 type transport system ATP-binding protein